jgi:hypothetical protein
MPASPATCPAGRSLARSQIRLRDQPVPFAGARGENETMYIGIGTIVIIVIIVLVILLLRRRV